MQENKMCIFQISNGSIFYSPSARIADGMLELDARDTCLVQVTQDEQKGTNINGLNIGAIVTTQLIFSPSMLRIPISTVLQMTDMGDEKAREMLDGTIAKAGLKTKLDMIRLVKP